MPSSLTWIDHDPTARERSLRILALFQERESRDELGLGGIRDSFADQLFPGTSTIQTRLRYMLFVPWIYTHLEKKKVSPGEFAVQADRVERSLITPLLSADDRSGIFGSVAGKGLKRLPSSVYWAGLGAWGIRLVNLSQDQYYRYIGTIYRRRAEQEARDKERSHLGDDREATPEPGTLTWHTRLPSPPAGFPMQVNFALTTEEANFIQDRLQRTHPESLLAHLALHCKPSNVEAPWLHPDRATFRTRHIELLDHAKCFSEVMHGAALIYNLALTEKLTLETPDKRTNWEKKVEEYRERLSQWASKLRYSDLSAWSISRLWELTLSRDHTITPATRNFVQSWIRITLDRPARLGEDGEARDLIRQREMSLKRNRSRFTNRRALEQWGGTSGLGQLVYRWPNARTLLNDLYVGLTSRGANAQS